MAVNVLHGECLHSLFQDVIEVSEGPPLGLIIRNRAAATNRNRIAASIFKEQPDISRKPTPIRSGTQAL